MAHNFERDWIAKKNKRWATQLSYCVCRRTWRSTGRWSTLNFCDCGRLHYCRSWKWVCGFGSVYCHQCFCDCLYLGKGGVYGKCLLLASHTAGSAGHRNPGDEQVKMRCVSICFGERVHLRWWMCCASLREYVCPAKAMFYTFVALYSFPEVHLYC